MSGIALGRVSTAGGEYQHLALHADAMLALATRRDTEIVVVDIQGEAIRWTLNGHAAKVVRASVSFDGTKALAQLTDGAVHLWDLTNGTAIAIMAPVAGSIAAAGFRADDEQVVVLHQDGTGRVYSSDGGDVAAVDASAVLDVPGDWAAQLAFVGEGRLLIGVSSTELPLPHVASLDLQTRETRSMDVSFLSEGRSFGRFRSVTLRRFNRSGSRMLAEDGDLFPGHGWFAEIGLVDMAAGRLLPQEHVGGVPRKLTNFSSDGGLFVISYHRQSVMDSSLRIGDAMSGQTRYDGKTDVRYVEDVGVACHAGHVVFAYAGDAVTLSYRVLTLPQEQNPAG